VGRFQFPEDLDPPGGPHRALAVAEEEVRGGHDPVGRRLFVAIVDPLRDPQPPLARHERPIRLADPRVDLRDPAAEFGDQIALGGEPFRESQRLVEPLDGGLVVVPVEGDLAQILERDHPLALEAVLLGLGERTARLPVGGAKIAAHPEEPCAHEARLDLPLE
jgi:hypothetical protein